MGRIWTCQGCKTIHPRVKQKCPCGRSRPKARRPEHAQALDLSYEEYVAMFGERCGICLKRPSATRRLDRDHWHSGPFAGQPRGLLCARCNRAIPNWMTAGWMLRALDYLAGAERRARLG